MKLSVGKIAFPIEFDNGDKDVIYFNPNDPDLATRLMGSRKRIDEKINAIKSEDFELLNDGSIEVPKDMESFSEMTDEQHEELVKKAEQMTKIMEETKNIIYEELNFAFDSDISNVVFKHCSPFAVVNGEYFISQFLTAITPEIQKYATKASTDMEKKMSKHLNKYTK